MTSLSRVNRAILFLLLATAAMGADMRSNLASEMDLRGPVKQCVQETTYLTPEGSIERSGTITRTFSPAGLLLEERVTHAGGPDYTTHYTYDSAGHLLNTTRDDMPQLGGKYQYDAQGRLRSFQSASGQTSATYDYEGDRLVRVIEHFPIFPNSPNTAIAAVPWERGDVSYPPPSGGTVTTIYDQQQRVAGAEIRDANGVLIRTLVRHYDEKGHITGDELTSNEVDVPLSEDLEANFNDAQKKAMLRFINRSFGTMKSTYKYDDQSRVIEKHVVGGVLGDTVTTFTYDDHGSVTDELKVQTPDVQSTFEFQIDERGNMIPERQTRDASPQRTEARYTYEYDAQGNWTKKTTAWRSSDSSEFKESTVVKRKISYY